MTAEVVLFTVGGLLVCGGLVGTLNTIRGVSIFPPRTRSTAGSSRTLTVTPTHLLAFLVAIGVLVLTGWPVAAITTTAAVVFVPQVLGGGKQTTQLIAKSEALADWTRRLADLISSGAAGSTRDALRRSLTSVPEPIEAEVTSLVHRMGPQGTEPALRQFAREVNDPAADKIAGVLILRERNGGPGLADVLTALAGDLDDRSRIVREVESERAKPRSNMRTIVVVTGVLIVGMMLFARTFLSAYSSVTGQALLVGVAAVFAIALRWMRSLSHPPTHPRVLLDPDLAGQS